MLFESIEMAAKTFIQKVIRVNVKRILSVFIF
jgi:hypothetical protein